MIEKEVNKSKLITLNNIVDFFKDWRNYLGKHFLKMLFFSLIGGLLGFYYAYQKPIKYIAKTTFILEEGKTMSSGLGGLASLAGQFGVDVGSVTGGGILSGDNILLYFKSPTLAREVLLSNFDSVSSLTLADAFVKVHKFDKRWKKDKNIGEVLFSSGKNKKFTRLQDSLIQVLSQEIIDNHFSVSKVDKKAGFIDVATTMNDEMLAKEYCERIVQRVVDRYINIKIQRQKSTVDKLQSRVDSISFLLGRKTFIGASLQNSTSTMDINPLYKTETNVAMESTIRDKTLLATIFASVTQNLEIAKFTLSQETPVIQIVDSPLLPLKEEKASKIVFALLSFIFIFTLFSIFLVVRRIILSDLKR